MSGRSRSCRDGAPGGSGSRTLDTWCLRRSALDPRQSALGHEAPIVRTERSGSPVPSEPGHSPLARVASFDGVQRPSRERGSRPPSPRCRPGRTISAASPTCSGSDVTFEQATGTPAANASHTGPLAASKRVGTTTAVASRRAPSALRVHEAEPLDIVGESQRCAPALQHCRVRDSGVRLIRMVRSGPGGAGGRVPPGGPAWFL